LPSTIEQVHREYADRGLVVLGISIGEGRRKVAGWSPSRSLTVPLLLDPEGAASAAYQVTATPAVFLVGRDGRLVARGYGTKPWTSDRARAVFHHLLRK
jgi:peroxiredoxin